MKSLINNIKRYFSKKDILIVLISWVILVTIILNLTYKATKILMIDMVNENGNKDSKVYAKSISDWINSRIRSVQIYSNTPTVISMDWDKIKYYLENEQNRTMFVFDDMFLVNKDGTFKSILYNYFGDFSDTNCFSKGMKGESFISEPFEFENNIIHIVVSPIKKNNEVIGLLGGVISSDKITKLMKQYKMDFDGAYSYIVDDEGLTISHPEVENILTENITKKSNVISEEIVNASKTILDNKTGHVVYLANGKLTYAYFNSISNTDNWKLVTRIPLDYINNPIKQRLKIVLIIGVLGILIIGIATIHISNVLYKRRIKFEKEIKLKEEMLKEQIESENLKTEFLSNISHELKTPLNMIFSSIQLLNIYNKDINNNDKLDKHLKIIKQNSFRLLRLINNLIDITRIHSGYMVLNLENKDIIKVVEDITMSTVEYVKNKNRSITFDTNVEELVMAIDCDKIERIVLNLISNAVKFTKEEDLIEVCVLYDGDIVIITIKDTGIGIPKDKLELIFERFKQVEPLLNRSHEGSGLGLPLTKSLVEMHGGKISVDSNINEGTEFIIELPVKLIDEKDYKDLSKSHKPSNVEKIDIEFSDIYS